jgi:hypothetical protein
VCGVTGRVLGKALCPRAVARLPPGAGAAAWRRGGGSHSHAMHGPSGSQRNASQNRNRARSRTREF